MKKTISFEKRIEFPSMIGEITSISLEHNLKFIDSSNIEGDFIVSGTYKLTEASRIEEDFKYNLPAEIIIGEKLDQDTSKIDIDDFYYEIENDYTLICYIDVKIEGVELVEIEEEPTKEDLQKEPLEDLSILEEKVLKIEELEVDTSEEKALIRECDSDFSEQKEEKKMEKETKEMEKEEMTEAKERPVVSSLFENINETEETYATYSVYILREEETINSIIEKYKTTKEELESYNDLSTLSIGSKIIIPLHEE